MKKLIPKFFKLLSFLNVKLAASLALKLFMHPRRIPRSAEEMNFLTTGRQITFKSQRKARVWGKGDTIWLLHGWESRGSTFYKFIPLLLEKGFQVIAWDAPAHGDSPGKTTNVPDYARSLAIDMNENLFEQPVAILGHSFGGAALAVLSKIHPMPPKTVICSAPTSVQNIFDNFAKMINLNDKAKEKFIKMAESKSGYSLFDGSLIANDISKTSDVLIIHDRQDDLIPFTNFEALQQSWLSGKFVATENLGHRLTIKDPEVLNIILNFLK